LVQVRVRKHNLGRFAAKLKHGRDVIGGCGLRDLRSRPEASL
jgi:hypothetical protein